MPADIRRKWTPDGTVVEVMNPSNKCNGMTYDADLNLLVCEHSTSSVVREQPDGTRETLATHYQGKELNSPNDIVVHSSGAIYFSDPTYGRWPGFGIERDRDLDFQGVYRLPPGGGDPQLLVDDFGEPNGLCFSPDESVLYINDTPNALIRVFDVESDGTLANGRMFAESIGDGDLAKGGLVDGMKCDERGNVWVDGPRRRLGVRAGRRAPRRGRDPGGRREHPLGRPGLEVDVRARLDLALPVPGEGRREPRAVHERVGGRARWPISRWTPCARR